MALMNLGYRRATKIFTKWRKTYPFRKEILVYFLNYLGCEVELIIKKN